MTADKKRLEAVGIVGAGSQGSEEEEDGKIHGVINDLSVSERMTHIPIGTGGSTTADSTSADRDPAATSASSPAPAPAPASSSSSPLSLIIAAAVGTEHRLGRWFDLKRKRGSMTSGVMPGLTRNVLSSGDGGGGDGSMVEGKSAFNGGVVFEIPFE